MAKGLRCMRTGPPNTHAARGRLHCDVLPARTLPHSPAALRLAAVVQDGIDRLKDRARVGTALTGTALTGTALIGTALIGTALIGTALNDAALNDTVLTAAPH